MNLRPSPGPGMQATWLQPRTLDRASPCRAGQIRGGQWVLESLAAQVLIYYKELNALELV